MMKEIIELFKRNNSIRFSELLFDYETFEEPPLIFRYNQLDSFKNHLNENDISTLLFSLAFCHLNNTRLYAKKILSQKDFNQFFICLTCINTDNELKEIGECEPNFFVTRKISLMHSLINIPRINFDDYPIFRVILNNLGLEESIIILHEKWFDEVCNEELQRFFFIKKEDFERLLGV